MRPPRPCGEPGVGGDRRRLDAAAPHDAAGRGSSCRRRASTWPGPTSVTAAPRWSWTPLRVEHLGDVVVRRVGERPEQRVRRGRRCGPARRRDREVVVLGGHRLVDQVGERAGDLDAGRAAADDHEVQRALRRSAPGRGRPSSKTPDDARAQARRVVERVQRERVRSAPRGAEEVRLRARPRGRPRRPRALAVRRGDRRGVAGSTDATSPSLTSTLASSAEQLAQRVRDVARRQLGGRDLVEQRLELVVVVAVDQRHVDVVVLGEPPRAADARRSRRRR